MEEGLTDQLLHASQLVFHLAKLTQQTPILSLTQKTSSYQIQIRANDCYLFNQNSTNHPRVTLLRNHTLKGYKSLVMLSDMVSDNILKTMTELSTVKLTANSSHLDSKCIMTKVTQYISNTDSDSQSDTYIYSFSLLAMTLA